MKINDDNYKVFHHVISEWHMCNVITKEDRVIFTSNGVTCTIHENGRVAVSIGCRSAELSYDEFLSTTIGITTGYLKYLEEKDLE